VFSPGDSSQARQNVGVAADAVVLLFVGRIQPLKAPDLLIKAAADMVARHPSLRQRLCVVICGGPSGTGLTRPDALVTLAQQLGIADLVRFVPPTDRTQLVDWFRAADLCVVPSYSESFGLVAVEAQACGTPVVAARVGGLRTAVDDGVSGVLVDGHSVNEWSAQLADLVNDPDRVARLRQNARRHASRFGWDKTVEQLLAVYEEAVVSARLRSST
jgi:D-inositol-3-phosphate glycosyltransferase